MTISVNEIRARSQCKAGEDLYSFAAELFPICRSITGNGVRETLRRIQQRIPVRIVEVPTGTTVFDWTVPKEWNIRDAYIKDSSGKRVVDFQQNNLHVLNYSTPFHATVSREDLSSHLFTLPEHPDWIPYRTSYYKEQWGFCLSQNQLDTLGDGNYEVCIDSTLHEGSLTYGECYLPGESEEEVLISAHVCHPSLANDNLSGIIVSTALAELLSGAKSRYSYRFLFIPGTIGAITWLATHCDVVNRIRHGLVLTGIGNRAGFHYKKSRQGDAAIDRVMSHVLRYCGEASEIVEFSPYGYDERQYCSPGFNLPVGCLMRSVWGTFSEYHTSADNLSFIDSEQLVASLRLCASAIDILENDHRYVNQNPFCEPQLGKRGLYRSTGGQSIGEQINARLWVLNLSDGSHSLLDIAERASIPFPSIHEATTELCKTGLLVEVGNPTSR